MKPLKLKTLLHIFLWIGMLPNAYSQASKAVIKLYAEMKGIHYYLDEKFKGIDIAQIEDVDSGGHYLKAIVEEVVVFGEIVNVGSTGNYPVLIKNNQEVQRKILDAKFKQIQEYKNSKVDILISKSYVSTTTGGSSSVTYPNYYTYNTQTKINTTTTMTEVTDWKIVVGGTREISEYQLATMTNNQALLNNIETHKNYIDAKNNRIRKGNNTRMAIGLPMFIVSAAGCITLFPPLLFKSSSRPEWYNRLDQNHPNFIVPALTSSIMGSLIGYGLSMADTKYLSYSRQLSLTEAALAAQEANIQLKKRLGLPENFEP